MRVWNPLQKYRDLSLEKRSVIWYTICNILSKGIAFFTIPIITRLLTTEEYGRYSVFLSWKDIFIIITTLNLYTGIYTKVLVDHKDTQDECTSVIQWLGSFISLGFLILYLLFRNTVNRLLGYDTPTMLLLNVFYFFYPAYCIWCNKQRVNNKYIRMVIGTLIVTLLAPLTSIFLVLNTDLRERGVIFGYLLVNTAAGIFFFALNTMRGRRIYDAELWRYSVNYSIPLIPHYLSLIVLGQSDRLMIKYMEGEDKAGIYSLAYQIASMMNIVFNAINNAFVPRAYRFMRDGTLKELTDESMKLIVGAFALSVFGILIAPECVLFMGGKAYSEAVFVIPAVCFAAFIRYVFTFFSNYEFYFARTKNIMYASVLAAVINILLNWVFIPIFGYFAAGYTTLVGYAFLYLFHYRYARKICMEHFGEEGLKTGMVLMILSVTCAASAVMPFLYNLAILRYSLLVVLLAVGIIQRKRLLALIR